MTDTLPKVMVAAPISEKKDYCFDRYAEQVTSFTYPNYIPILIDNSPNLDYCERIASKRILSLHVDPDGRSAPEFITVCMNLIREYFLQSDMDFLFILETDVFVPEDIIQRMICYRYPVLNVSYLYREELDAALCMQGIVLNKKYATSFAVGRNVGFDAYDGTVKLLSDCKLGDDMQMVATGIGCTMIHRSVVEQIPFRYEKENVAGFCDSYFHLDCLLKGIPNYIDTTIIAEHDRRGWRDNMDVWK